MPPGSKIGDVQKLRRIACVSRSAWARPSMWATQALCGFFFPCLSLSPKKELWVSQIDTEQNRTEHITRDDSKLFESQKVVCSCLRLTMCLVVMSSVCCRFPDSWSNSPQKGKRTQISPKRNMEQCIEFCQKCDFA